MSDQAKKAAKLMREKLGGETVDALAPAAAARDMATDGQEDFGPPSIELPGVGRPVTGFAREAGRYMATAPLFLRENVVVMVDEVGGKLVPLNPDEFATFVEDYMTTYKPYYISAGKGKDKSRMEDPTTMTTDTAKKTMGNLHFKAQLRRITRVNQVPMPVFRADGSLELLKEGYDEASETYTLKSGITIDEKMTPEQGAHILRDRQAEFPHADERSRSVSVAHAVAHFVFGLQELTSNRMGFLFKANRVRTGKSLSAMMGLAGPHGLAAGQTIVDKEELKKLLDATALEGTPYLFFDNLTGHIKSNQLESFMTQPRWSGRVFGSNSKTFSAPKGCIVIITGNNITTSEDIANRCLLCYLHTDEADPQARKLKRIFTPQKLARPDQRGDMLSALWAIVRGWNAAGRGKDLNPGPRRIAGFEEWAELVGGIVINAGFEDPLQKPKDDEATNTDEVDARELVSQLSQLIPSHNKAKEFTFQEVINVCYQHKCFDWKLDGKWKEDEGGYFDCNKTSMSALGKVLGEDMSGQKFTLQNGARVQFGKRGKNRHRRYMVTILSDPTDGSGAAAAGGAGAVRAAGAAQGDLL